MFTEAELFFVREELDLHGEYLMDLFGDSIERLGLEKSGDLLDSLRYTVTTRNGNACLSIQFESYGRIIEIRYFKKRKSVWEVVDTRKAMWGIHSPQKRNKKKKDTRFYSANAYGSLNKLIGRIGSSASDEIMQRIKDYIQQNPNWQSSPAYVNRYQI